MSEETKPGSMDDNAAKRIADRKKEQERQMQQIFDDNKSGRYSDPQND